MSLELETSVAAVVNAFIGFILEIINKFLALENYLSYKIYVTN